MIPLSITGLFCEDVRVEIGDIFTLVGLLPDNITIQSHHREKAGTVADLSNVAWLTKLCIFVRANFDPDDPIKEIALTLTLPDQREVYVGGAQPEIIEKAKHQARENNAPLAGVIIRSVIAPFNLQSYGIMRLEATIAGEKRLIAFQNFKLIEQPRPSSESRLPSGQSPSGAP